MKPSFISLPSRISLYLFTIFTFAFFATAYTAEATAQEVRGQISGQVVDPQGAVVPGATVKVKNEGTGVETTATTNEEGRYSVLFLNPATYTVTVEAPSYKRIVRSGVEVSVEDKIELNFTTEIGSIDEQINVTDSAPLLDTETASVGHVLDSRLISELPTPDGNPFLLARLASGIIDDADPTFTRPHDTINVTQMTVNGVANQNEFTIDNAPNTGVEKRVAFIPPADAVEEFKVTTLSTNASTGHASGATINVSTKSGKNQLNGSLYEFVRNDIISANTFDNIRRGRPRQGLRYNRFGGSVGGPVMLPRFWAPDMGHGGDKLFDGRNRTFFFFSYEGLIDSIPDPQTTTVPTLEMRRGDFSGLFGGEKRPVTVRLSKDGCLGKRGDVVNVLNPDKSPAYIGQIYDPATAVLVTDQCNPYTNTVEPRIVRTPFRDNIIPRDRLSPMALRFLEYMPLPNSAPSDALGRNNFFNPAPEVNRYNSQTVRLDHRYSENNNSYWRYTRGFRTNVRKSWTGEVNGIIPTGDSWNRNSQSLTYDHVYTVNSNTVLNMRAGVSYFADAFTVPSKGKVDLADFGFSENALKQFLNSDYFPQIGVSGFGTLGSALDGPATSTVYSGLANLTKIKGNHTFVVGYDVRLYRENEHPDQHAAGSYSFGDRFTKGPWENSSGHHAQGLVSFLLGVPTGGSIDRRVSKAAQQIYQAFFIQDDWKVNRKLTLNLGLRYEYEAANTERYNRAIRGFDINVPTSPELEAGVRQRFNSLATKPPGITDANFLLRGGYVFADENNRGLWEPEKNHLLPRIGVAYQINDKTVLRAGLSYNVATVGAGSMTQVGYSQTTDMIVTQNNGLNLAAGQPPCLTCSTFDNPYPFGVIEPRGTSLGYLTNVGGSIGNVNHPGFRKMSRSRQWNVSLQRELPGKFVVEATYVGTKGYNRGVFHNINTTPREYLSTTPLRDEARIALLDTRYDNPFRGLLPLTNDLNTNAQLRYEQFLVPYPHFGTISFPTYDGENVYHSGQFRAQKRMSKGYMGFVTYTWSKNIEMSSLLNPTDTEYEHRLSGNDTPHRVTVGTILELPFGRKRAWGKEWHGLIDTFLGGWQLGATYVYQVGSPLDLGNIYYDGDLRDLRVNISKDSARPITALPKGVPPYNTLNNVFGIDLRESGFYLRDAAVMTNGQLDLVKQREDSRIRLAKNLRTMPSNASWLRGHARNNLDFSMIKKIFIGENMHIQLRGEMINALNRVLFRDPEMDPTDANFGLIGTQRNPPRYFQLGARFVF
jgi:hypothetical protein